MTEFCKALCYGFVEGVTEWIPVSSTGHLILLDRFCPMNVRAAFGEVFRVVIQLGAILAVVILYWQKLVPVRKTDGAITVCRDVFPLWGKMILAGIPAAIVGLWFDDWVDTHFYNTATVAVMLITVGLVFLVAESFRTKGKRARVSTVEEIRPRDAFLIGMFQLAAAVLPGTSRSGATIVGGLLIGFSRAAAAEFSFCLAVPSMAGASLLKLLKCGTSFTAAEWGILSVGTVTAFAVSLVCVRFLADYVKRHDFRAFGWYRIVLGTVAALLLLARIL